MTFQALISEIHCTLSANQKRYSEFNKWIIIESHFRYTVVLHSERSTLTDNYIYELLDFVTLSLDSLPWTPADISRRHHWFPRELTSEERAK